MRTRTKRLIRAQLLMSVPALIIACAGEPLGLEDQPTEPQQPADVRFAAAQESGEYVLTEDFTTFHPCIGEDLHTTNSWLARYHQVLTPSGNFNYMDILIELLESEIVGLESGTNWSYLGPLPGPFAFHAAKGSVLNVTATFRLLSDDGRRMLVKNRFHFTVNANGVPTATRVVLADCRLIGPS